MSLCFTWIIVYYHRTINPMPTPIPGRDCAGSAARALTTAALLHLPPDLLDFGLGELVHLCDVGVRNVGSCA